MPSPCLHRMEEKTPWTPWVEENGHYVRLGSHGAVNSSHVGKSTLLSLCGFREEIVNHRYRRNVERRVVGVVELDGWNKNSDMPDFSLGCHGSPELFVLKLFLSCLFPDYSLLIFVFVSRNGSIFVSWVDSSAWCRDQSLKKVSRKSPPCNACRFTSLCDVIWRRLGRL